MSNPILIFRKDLHKRYAKGALVVLLQKLYAGICIAYCV